MAVNSAKDKVFQQFSDLPSDPQRVWLVRLANDRKAETGAIWRNREKGMHVKLCHLASEKHRFGPEMVSEATS